MKPLQHLKPFRTICIVMVIAVLTLYGCIKQKEPSVSLQNGRFMTTNVDIVPGGVLRFKWIAEKGKADLESFTIKVNGTDLSGYPRTPIGPELYFDSTFMEGPAFPGDYIYAFIAYDVDGNFGEKAIVVSVE